MTYAPARLLEVRHYMKPITGLSDAELGITPDPAHDGGYHCGWDQRRIVNGSLADYAWQESSRDWNHKTNAARAFDLGNFARLREFSIWLVGQCAANAEDTRDIREVIYSPDGQVVKRWDRLGRRTSGDSSHLTHTHISYFADAEDRDKVSPFRRFFEGDDMGAERTSYNTDRYFWLGVMQMLDQVAGIRTDDADPTKVVTIENVMAKTLKKLVASAAADETRDAATLAAIQALAGHGGPEVAPIIEAINAQAEATRALVEQKHQVEMAELARAHEAEKAGLVAELERLDAGQS